MVQIALNLIKKKTARVVNYWQFLVLFLLAIELGFQTFSDLYDASNRCKHFMVAAWA